MSTTTGIKHTTAKRIVRFASVAYSQPIVDPLTVGVVVRVPTASRGDEIELHPSEEQRLDDLGALLPQGATRADAEKERGALQDLYRGQRGDTEAMSRAAQRASADTDQAS